MHGSVDDGYRDELIERFDLAPDKKIRAYSHGNRQKVLLIAAFASRADAAAARRADDAASTR